MSRQYDAKQQVLKAYPEDRESGVDLFQEIMDCSESDFRYDEGVGFEEYIYGPVILKPIPNEQDRSVEDIEGFEL